MKPPRRFAVEAARVLRHYEGVGRPVFSGRYFLGMATLLIMGLCSCVSSDQSGKALVNSWNARFGRINTQGEGSVPWQGTTVREFVYEGIAVKDYEYKKYVDLIRRGTSWGGFGAQTASIGLNAAGTLTSGGTTKTLSAIAGTITGASAAFSKNILFDQSITVFVGRMDALRKAKLDRMRERLAEGGYGYAEAYRDIQDYGYQGSLDAALANVSKSTPEETKESE
jgi:hypothetical protein